MNNYEELPIFVAFVCGGIAGVLMEWPLIGFPFALLSYIFVSWVAEEVKR